MEFTLNSKKEKLNLGWNWKFWIWNKQCDEMRLNRNIICFYFLRTQKRIKHLWFCFDRHLVFPFSGRVLCILLGLFRKILENDAIETQILLMDPMMVGNFNYYKAWLILRFKFRIGLGSKNLSVSVLIHSLGHLLQMCSPSWLSSGPESLQIHHHKSVNQWSKHFPEIEFDAEPIYQKGIVKVFDRLY